MKIFRFSFSPSAGYGHYFDSVVVRAALALVLESQEFIKRMGKEKFLSMFDTYRIPVQIREVFDILTSKEQPEKKIALLSDHFKSCNFIYLQHYVGENFSVQRLRLVRDEEPKPFKVLCLSEVEATISRAVLRALQYGGWGTFSEETEDYVPGANPLSKEALAFLQSPSPTFF